MIRKFPRSPQHRAGLPVRAVAVALPGWVAFALLFGLIMGLTAQAQSPTNNFGPGLGNRPQKTLKLPASGEVTFASHTASEVYADLNTIETKLYAKSYSGEPIKDRLKRIEKTLFGGYSRGPLEDRFINIKRKMKIANVAETGLNDDAPLVEYLERKLFQRNFDSLSFDERIAQLESHVFGRTFSSYPLDVRVKKLTYTIPIVAKEIRLSSEGTVVATTRPRNVASSATGNPRPQAVLETTRGETVITGDFIDTAFRQSDGRFLRWTQLPVRIHVRNANSHEEGLTDRALERWRPHFPLATVSSPYTADVIVDWQGTVTPRIPVTRPILHLDTEKTIRTVVLVNMTPYKTLSRHRDTDEVLLRGLLHQLGHAFGIWGHSRVPDDIMYPSQMFEYTDIPDRWRRRSPKPSDLSDPVSIEDPRPSQRDINTLTKIYKEEAVNLRTFSPHY